MEFLEITLRSLWKDFGEEKRHKFWGVTAGTLCVVSGLRNRTNLGGKVGKIDKSV